MDLSPRHLISRVVDAIKGRKWNTEKPVTPDEVAQSDPKALNRKGRRIAAMEAGRIIRRAKRQAFRQLASAIGRPIHHHVAFKKRGI